MSRAPSRLTFLKSAWSSFVSQSSANHPVSQAAFKTAHKAVIHLEGWGISAEEASTVAATLNQQLPQIDWRSGVALDSEALMVHLVDISALAGATGHAVWNTYGPVEAMRQEREAGTPALALCRGKFSELPSQRAGVWIASAGQAWVSGLQTLARALAAMGWKPEHGYRDLPGWAGVRPLLNANLLAVMATDHAAADFPSLMRQVSASSIAHPIALAAAGVSRHAFDRTRIEAGMHDLDIAVVAPMTLDGTMRADALVGYPWPVIGG